MDHSDSFIEQDERDGVTRREFIEVLSASFAALSLTGCDLRPPKEKIVPYIEQHEGVVPGIPNWFASSCQSCAAACGVLVKVRDGRPIKLEGNPMHPVSQGGLCARGQASVLDLYDSQRLAGSMS
ncbi:MAG: molybdopterin oxidoreductase, partial [Elusimicrobiota bacterium]